MVGTITPVGHGGSRSRWVASLGLHTLGAVVAAAALGAALGGLGWVLGGPSPAAWTLVGAAGALYAAREVGVPVPLPERRRQVPSWWHSYFRSSVASLLYGVGLGAGLFTHLRHGTLVVVALAVVASGDPALGAFAIAPFGLARGASIIVAWRGTSSREVSRIVHRLETIAVSAAPRAANGLVLLALAVWSGARAGTQGAPGTAAAVVAIAFAWAALAKARAPARWRNALRAYRLGMLERPAAVVVPVLEASVPLLMLAGFGPVAGGVGLVLLAAFSAGLLRAKGTIGDELECGCFGGTTRRDWRVLVARNAALAVVAVVALQGSSEPFLDPPARGEWLPAGLAALGVVAAALIVTRALGAVRGAGQRTRPEGVLG